MTEAEWSVCEDPQAMLSWLNFGDEPVAQRADREPRVSDRKLRLFCCACRRAGNYEWPDRGGYDLWELDDYVVPPDHAQPAEMARSFCSPGVPANAPQAVCAALLREIVGDPFRPIAFDPAWRTPTVLSLAQAAYEERLDDGALDPSRLALLADALEEAGCDSQPLLEHLRGYERCGRTMNSPVGWRELPGPHVRGCWALDLILGKS